VAFTISPPETLRDWLYVAMAVGGITLAGLSFFVDWKDRGVVEALEAIEFSNDLTARELSVQNCQRAEREDLGFDKAQVACAARYPIPERRK